VRLVFVGVFDLLYYGWRYDTGMVQSSAQAFVHAATSEVVKEMDVYWEVFRDDVDPL